MKPFYRTTITKKYLRKLIVSFAKAKKIKRVYFNSRAKFIKGSYDANEQTVFLSNNETKQGMLRTFFHELSHHVAIKQKKWLNYHYNTKDITPSQMFKIENEIDKLAKKLWNKYVNIKKWGKYKYAYPKTEKTSLTSWLKNYHK